MGSKVQRDYSREFKLAALRRLDAGEKVDVLIRELGVGSSCLYRWRAQYRLGGLAGLRGRGQRPAAEAVVRAHGPPDDLERARSRIAELERKVGRQELELDFFQRALRATKEARRSGGGPGGTGSTGSSER